jgi:hypothetical protein
VQALAVELETGIWVGGSSRKLGGSLNDPLTWMEADTANQAFGQLAVGR